MKGNITATGKASGRRRTTGHFDSVEALEEAIASYLHDVPDVPWKTLGMIVGVSPTTARNIAYRLVSEGRIQPFLAATPDV